MALHTRGHIRAIRPATPAINMRPSELRALQRMREGIYQRKFDIEKARAEDLRRQVQQARNDRLLFRAAIAVGSFIVGATAAIVIQGVF